MKAFRHIKYGAPAFLHYCDIENLVPKSNQLLIKVCATTVNRTDCAMLAANPFIWRFFMGLFKPKNSILGTEFAGVVELIGENVTKFKTGDRVFGFFDQGLRSHAEYLTISESKALALIPANISYEQAAASIEGAHYAINFINKVTLKKGDKVLINGATGGIGSAALQLCKNLGAEITATCTPNTNELILGLGASRTIDYTKTDITTDNETYHYIFDTAGKSSFGKTRHLLKPGGVYISSELGQGMQNVWFALITLLFNKMPFQQGKKVKFPFPSNIKNSIAQISNLTEQGKFEAVIDKTYSFEQIIDAFEYVTRGKKTGNVVITFHQSK